MKLWLLILGLERQGIMFVLVAKLLWKGNLYRFATGAVRNWTGSITKKAKVIYPGKKNRQSIAIIFYPRLRTCYLTIIIEVSFLESCFALIYNFNIIKINKLCGQVKYEL